MWVAIVGMIFIAAVVLVFLPWVYWHHVQLSKYEPPGYLVRRLIGGEKHADIMARHPDWKPEN